MPIYEYICEKCGSHLEVMQKVSDAPLRRCSKCRGKLEKIFSRTSFQFKGGGWYVTDYAGKSSSKSDTSEKTSKPEKSSKKAESAATKD